MLTAIAVITGLWFAGGLYLLGGVLADRAGDAEWADADAAWQASGTDVVDVLRADIYRRAARLAVRGVR